MAHTLDFAYGGSHPAFPEPQSTDRVWHHLNLVDLLAILRTGKIHFSRLDKFDDPFEGTLPKAHVEAQAPVHKILRVNDDAAAELRAIARTYHAATCWYLSQHESDAMWRLYAKDGVAIRSTFGGLVSSFPPPGAPGPTAALIYAGKVSYVDYDSDRLTPIVVDGSERWNNGYIQVMHKRLSFAHEREVRAVVTAYGEGMIETPEYAARPSGIPPEGVLVPVDVQKLIEEVYVSPTKPDWFRDTVQDVIGKFGLDRTVKHSALSMKPY